MKESHLKILRAVLAQPIVPLYEQNVVNVIEAWAKTNGVPFSRDSYGNVLIRYRRGNKKNLPKWALVAHMDHPGFVVTGNQRGRKVDGDFLGNVPTKYLLGARLRLHLADGRKVLATIIKAKMSSTYNTHACTVMLDENVPIAPETIGTWDLPPMRISGGRLSTVGCDDTVGTASVLCAFEEIIASRRPVNVTGLLTRSEEMGLIGATAACRLKSIPLDSLVISIECSKAQPHAPIGGGAVVRVGDAFRTFDPGITAHLAGVARRLQNEGNCVVDNCRRSMTNEKDRGAKNAFKATRQLMPGGVCEASAFCLAGYRAGAVCLPLGNYHNCGANWKIKPEQVGINDFESVVTLLVETVIDKFTPADYDARGQEYLDNYLDYHHTRFKATNGK